ncbi:MAG: hypothetical protein GKS06_00285 [Acidobacteria bacterium]|nr:hypothetical protein [Acidobacteriota bacterium]
MPELPDFPLPDEDDELDQPYLSDEIKRLRLVTVEELEAAVGGEPLEGSEFEPELDGPGEIGELPPTGLEGGTAPSAPRRLSVLSRGEWSRPGSSELPGCGALWMLDFGALLDQECSDERWPQLYRAALLRAIAEANRRCASDLQGCERARVWLLHAKWGCDFGPTRNEMGFTIVLAVACVGR